MPVQKNIFPHIYKKYRSLIFVLITVFILEIFWAARTSLWVDEFFSWAIIKRPLSDLFFIKQFSRWYMNSFPPLYEVVVHLFLKVFPGDNVLLLRFPSIIFFLIMLFLVYILTLIICKRQEAAALAVFLIASNPAYLFYGHMLRGYIFFIDLIIISFLLIHLFLKSEYKIKYLILLSIIQCCMAYTFYTAFIIIIIEMLFIRVYVFRMKSQQISCCQLLLLFLPFIVFIPWAPNFAADLFIESLKGNSNSSFLSKMQVLCTNVLLRANIGFVMQGVLFPLSLIYVLYKGYKSKNTRIFPVILLIAVSFIGYTLVCLLLITKGIAGFDGPLYIRYFLPVFFIMFMFNCIFIVCQKRIIKTVLLFLLIVSIFFSAINGSYYWKNTPRIKDAAYYLKKYELDQYKFIMFFEDRMVIPGFLFYFLDSTSAYLATAPHYGNLKAINKILQAKSSAIRGNVIGINYFAFERTLTDISINNPELLILVDIDYFNSMGMDKSYNKEYNNLAWLDTGTENFIRVWNKIMEEKNLKYKLLDKKYFNGFVVAIYKKII